MGADTVHTFTGNGTFTPAAGVTSVQYLVVGGGGYGPGMMGGYGTGSGMDLTTKQREKQKRG